MSKISYRIKALAQKLPKQEGTITPGVYEELDADVIAYQKKLKNLIEIEAETKVQTNFVLELKLEDKQEQVEPEKQLQATTVKKYTRKTRRNINDDSN